MSGFHNIEFPIALCAPFDISGYFFTFNFKHGISASILPVPVSPNVIKRRKQIRNVSEEARSKQQKQETQVLPSFRQIKFMNDCTSKP